MEHKKGPEKAYRTGLSLVDVIRRFDTEDKAEAWFITQRWPHGTVCPHCASGNIAVIANRKPQPYRCRTCRKFFSVKTGTLWHSSKLPLSKWAIAFYLYSTNLKGVSSMKLHRDLGITQKSAWYMAHRIREMWNAEAEHFAGPVEADETYIGGKEATKHKSKTLHAGWGTVGKTAVAGVKERDTGQVSTAVVEAANQATLQGFVKERVAEGSIVYTDEARAYEGLPYPHETVRHSVGEYVWATAHTNGMESHWAMLKRGYVRVYHQMSVKHLPV